MANPVYFDRRKQQSTTTGTGSMALSAATGPYKNLNTTGFTITCNYCIVNPIAGEWETGYGFVDNTSSSLTRGPTDSSLSGGTIVNFSAGTKDCFITPTASSMTRVRPGTCDGRLTIVSGVPVPTNDNIGSTILYFTPYLGNNIAVPVATNQWEMWDFAEKTLTLASLTANQCYDIWIQNTGGNLSLGSTAWSNNTLRATSINYLDGVPFVGATSNLQRYLGTICADANGKVTDSAKQRFIWNFNNQVSRKLANFAQTGGWTITGGTAWRNAANDSGRTHAVEFVVGLQYGFVNARASAYVSTPSATSYNMGLALDNYVPGTDSYFCEVHNPATPTRNLNPFCEYSNPHISVGYHYLQQCESVQVGSGTASVNEYLANRCNTGILGTIVG